MTLIKLYKVTTEKIASLGGIIISFEPEQVKFDDFGTMLRNASFAAAAKYPCLAIPMGYSANGEPSSLTFIARPFEEDKLLKMGYAFEKETRIRKMPNDYR